MVNNEELDFGAIWKELWRSKLLIIFVTGIFAATSVFYALSLPNVYKSRSVLVSANSNKTNSLSSIASQFGGLASLAGINLGSNTSVYVIMEQLQSRDFINYFIDKYELKVPLFAATGWNAANQSFTYLDQDFYDVEKKQWIREVDYPLVPEPSADEAYELFMEVYKTNMDRKTKIITISLETLSPETSQKWLKLFIDEFNEYIRTKDILQTDANLKYLNEQVRNTDFANLQDALYGLIEEQLKKKMLSQAQKEYAVTILDAPSMPSEKSGPVRSVICIVGTFFGGFLSVAFVIVRLFFR